MSLNPLLDIEPTFNRLRYPTTPGVVAVLPFTLVVGPYQMAVHLVERHAMTAKRALFELEVNEQVVRLLGTMPPKVMARQFFRALVRLIHYASGCQQGCPEETYTHSFAAGLVAFAHHNPHAWYWFNCLLADVFARPALVQEVTGRSRRRYARPRQLYLGGQTIRVNSLSERASAKLRRWADYDTGTHEVRLVDALRGRHVAVVFLHELTHAVHNLRDMDDGSKHGAFVNAQVDGWLEFIAHNPGAWCWVLRKMREPGLASAQLDARAA